jgi:hypothetical protein
MVNILLGGPQRGCKSEKLSPALYMEREVAKVFPNDPSGLAAQRMVVGLPVKMRAPPWQSRQIESDGFGLTIMRGTQSCMRAILAGWSSAPFSSSTPVPQASRHWVSSAQSS